MNKKLEAKLKTLPTVPGVYFHKDAEDKVIYIGKAASLKQRVRQYFQASRRPNAKTDALVSEIVDTDWTTVETELDALFLEAELVRRYMPKWNILLRDDKSSLYVRINYSDKHPTVSYTRRPLDDGATYFGPYFNGFEVRRAVKHLRRAFPYSTHTNNVPNRACLQAHLGLCPNLEEHPENITQYKANLRQLMKYMRGQRASVIELLEKRMQKAAKLHDYEKAAEIRDQYMSLKALTKQIVFSDKEFLDISKDRGLSYLSNLLVLDKVPERIEGYDISHMQGTDNVASMVVFANGMPDKAAYRKFKMRIPGNNDFAHINEVIKRRCSEKNIKAWGLPDIFLIDGGKGQLAAAIDARDELGVDRPMIGLAKREEEIVIHLEKSKIGLSNDFIVASNAILHQTDDFVLILLQKNSDLVKLLQRIRDESHRFAVSYHSVLKGKRQTASALDDIAGVGPVTRKKLIKHFGSMKGVKAASEAELVALLGAKKGKQVADSLAN